MIGRAVLLSCLALTLGACTMLRDVPVPAAAGVTAPPDVRKGQRVIVTLKSGEVRRFRVTAIRADALEGSEVRIAYADIQSLEVHRFSTFGTVMAVTAGVLLAVYGILFH